MSRIYDNKPMSALPVDNVDWKTEWRPQNYQQGFGVLIEGRVRGRSRHTIVQSASKKSRYVAFHVVIHRAHRRKFTPSGQEIEPNFSDKEKVSPLPIPTR